WCKSGRGGLVGGAGLVEASQAGKRGGGGLAVFERAPPRKGHPLFALDNVLLTPHAAGVDLQSRDDMALSAAQAIVSLSKGEWPAEKIVNAEARARFRW